MKKTKYVSELFDYAYFPKYDESIEYLAEKLAEKEQWNFSSTTKNNYGILKNYLEFTFRKLKRENKVVFTKDNEYACFNTGLLTNNLEEIFTFFERYSKPPKNAKYAYCFKAFLKKSDNLVLKHFVENLPEMTDYFTNPEMLLFNPRLNIIVDIDHIIQDNKNRFPDDIVNKDEPEMRRQLMGAIEDVKIKVRNNYKLAVPQFYKDKIQLLLPLCLTAGSPNPDLALVLTKLNETTYTAKTCLTIEMAYQNARLIVKPESNWLKP